MLTLLRGITLQRTMEDLLVKDFSLLTHTMFQYNNTIIPHKKNLTSPIQNLTKNS